MKRMISIFLALVMIISTMSIGVFAVDEVSEPAVPETEEAVAAESEDFAEEVAPEEEAVVEEAAEAEEAEAVADEDLVAADSEAKSAKKKVLEITLSAKAAVLAGQPTAAIVKWNCTGAPDGYTVKIIPLRNGKTVENGSKFSGSKGRAKVTGLSPSTKYNFKVEVFQGKTALGVDVTTKQVITPLAKVQGLKTYSAYNSIALEWKPVEKATKYYVYRNNKKIATVSNKSRAYDNKDRIAYINKGIKNDKKYKYSVVAVNGATKSVKCKAVADSKVRPMYFSITFNRTRTLYSHDGANAKATFSGGFSTKAFGYRMGKYFFMYNGHEFHVNYMSLNVSGAQYTKSFNYSGKEAEYFAKTANATSDTQYVIFASLYTQHIYILKKKAGNWRLTKISSDGYTKSNWEISSGTAWTPSPTGLTLGIHRKLANKGGVVWWNYFHSLSSIHGRAGSAPLGEPHSHGCLRNPDEYARIIYKVVPIGSRVMVY